MTSLSSPAFCSPMPGGGTYEGRASGVGVSGGEVSSEGAGGGGVAGGGETSGGATGSLLFTCSSPGALPGGVSVASGLSCARAGIATTTATTSIVAQTAINLFILLSFSWDSTDLGEASHPSFGFASYKGMI